MDGAERCAIDAADHGARGCASNGSEAWGDRSGEGACDEATNGARCTAEDRTVQSLSRDVLQA
jgi:hypothetical protein